MDEWMDGCREARRAGRLAEMSQVGRANPRISKREMVASIPTHTAHSETGERGEIGYACFRSELNMPTRDHLSERTERSATQTLRENPSGTLMSLPQVLHRLREGDTRQQAAVLSWKTTISVKGVSKLYGVGGEGGHTPSPRWPTARARPLPICSKLKQHIQNHTWSALKSSSPMAKSFGRSIRPATNSGRKRAQSAALSTASTRGSGF